MVISIGHAVGELERHQFAQLVKAPGGSMTTPLGSVRWIHGARRCADSTDPLIQVHEFDEDTFVLRLSKCFSFEGNFLYLLFGTARAILFDTGGRPDNGNGTVLPIRSTVDGIVAGWLRRHGLGGINLVVAHTHSHGDHVFWDRQFASRPRTNVVEPTLPCGVPERGHGA